MKLAPHVYSVVEENEHVRILNTVMKPGDKTEMHGHPNLVAVCITDGKYRFTSPDGQTMEVELKAGMAMCFPAAEHETENIGTAEGQVILVELK